MSDEDRELLDAYPWDVWPLTIMRTRYGGCYETDSRSGAVEAKWAAFNLHPHEINADAYGDDITAADFWWGLDAKGVGRGRTPGHAVSDLVQRMNRSDTEGGTHG